MPRFNVASLIIYAICLIGFAWIAAQVADIAILSQIRLIAAQK